MSTQVRHGARPRFTIPVAKGRYGVTLLGRYTKVDGWTAGGVTAFRYNSSRRAKRQAELLGMRTIFVHWWMREWLRTRGDWAVGRDHLRDYPWRRLRGQLTPKRTEPWWRFWR